MCICTGSYIAVILAASMTATLSDPFAYFEWVFEKLMHNPPAEQLEDLLPVNWIESRPAACQTIESHVA